MIQRVVMVQSFIKIRNRNNSTMAVSSHKVTPDQLVRFVYSPLFALEVAVDERGVLS